MEVDVYRQRLSGRQRRRTVCSGLEDFPVASRDKKVLEVDLGFET